MPSVNLDILHVRFSRAVEDTVASASSAGVQFSVVQREDYINRAINDIISDVYFVAGKERVRDLFQEMVTTQAITFSSSGVALAVDSGSIIKMLVPISLVKSGSTAIFVLYNRKDELDSNVNPNVTDAAYTIMANLLYAYESGVILNSGTGTFYYITKAAGVQGTTDVTINPGLFDAVIDYASILAFEETGDMQSSQARARRIQTLLSLVRGK